MIRSVVCLALILAAMGGLSLAPPASCQVPMEIGRLEASDIEENDWFGFAVSISSDVAVVTSYSDDDACPADPVCDSGSAYVFEQVGTGFSELRKLVASDASAGDHFGDAVSASRETIAVGASQANAFAGKVYVYGRNQGGQDAWGEVKILSSPEPVPEERFGAVLSLSQDTLAVGAPVDFDPSCTPAPCSASVYLFKRDAGGASNWGHVATIKASDAGPEDHFGTSVSLDFDTLVVGAALAPDNTRFGAAYIYERDLNGAGAWGERIKLSPGDLEAGDRFGNHVFVKGDLILVAAIFDGPPLNGGSVYIFNRNEGGDGQLGSSPESDRFQRRRPSQLWRLFGRLRGPSDGWC